MKKYELTQEQINQLAEKKYVKELLQKFIPELGNFYKGEFLKKEAIKRGFKNVGELSLKIVSGEMFKKGSFVTANNNFRYSSVENRLYLDGVEIFYNGEWAEIVIEDIPTQEEIDRVINYLKNK